MEQRLFVGITALALLLTQCMSLADAQLNRGQKEGRHDQAQGAETRILIGRVAVEGGSAQVPDATVVLECDASERTVTSLSVDGNFSLSWMAAQSSFEARSSSTAPSSGSAVAFCSLYADAPGYTSERLFISIDQPIEQVGTIILHPAKGQASAENATVSVDALAAPPAARKDFEKGNQQAKKKNWQSACDYFQRAIKIYPRYAIAWLELGRAQLQQHALTDAQRSFQQAIAEDNHFISGYLELTDVAAKQKDWTLVAATTDHLTQLAPEFSPKVWFFNSVAQFYLGNLSQAERSVKRGLRLDARHELPQMEYLYGMVLAREGNYGQAVEHIKTYLQLMPREADVRNVQSTLSKLEQLASQTALQAKP